MSVSNKKNVDVLVLGGGPAGSTTATLLRKYHPSLAVTLVEKAEFPRYHIGESLVLEVNRILAELDVLDEVEKHGFLRKGGATYVWGPDRKPWSFAFAESTGRRPHFDGISSYTYHVERAQFDRILLDNARKHGVEVLQPARVAKVLEEDGRVVGALVELPSGEHQEIRARFVVDASGRAGVIAKSHGTREFDKVLRNVATFGYWRGARLEHDYNGDWEVARICIVSHEHGWIWYIPMEPGVVSVGVVTSDKRHREVAAADPEKYHREVLAKTPETARWLEGAELVEFHNAPRKVMVESDFNYFHDRLHGPGYALVGDAAGFLDPLFTFGVFLSLTGARLLAYAIGTVFDGEGSEERMMSAYQTHMRTYFESFRAMLYTFYGFNTTKEAFWGQTREMVRSHALPDDMGDREAFMSTTFGFVVNSMLFHECTQHFGRVSLNRIRDMLLGTGDGQEQYNKMGEYHPEELAVTTRPKLVAEYTVHPSSVPLDGSGRMIPMARLEFQVPGQGDREAKFPRHFYMPEQWVTALSKLDGEHTLGDAIQAAEALPPPPYVGQLGAGRFLRHAVTSMVAMGIARVSAS